MLRRSILRCVVAAVVLTIAGIGFTKPPPVSGPVQAMDYDQTTDIILGLPSGSPPLQSFQGALADGAALPGVLSTFPPSPCAGTAAVWNGVLEDKKIHHHARKEALTVVLQVMATNECSLQIVRDISTTPPTIISLTPIP